ncbi:MAG: hypothetical protein JJU11_09695 [Candidatus Sumerlaeia bacterium]|nr:hypothetical protein [Candidatus Sumerlaeia bacterium]
MEAVLGLAEDPPTAFRPMPLWAWNDNLDLDELVRQVHRFHEAGLGGFIMHGRAGLRSGYLDESWEAAVRTVLETCRPLDMRAWIYDEWGWPSGFAAGTIPGRGREWQQHYLIHERIPADKAVRTPETIGFYELDSARTHIPHDNFQVNGSHVLHIRWGVNPYYVDHMNPEVTRAFIDIVYTWYKDRFEEDFGKTIPGIFTDEPQFGREHVVWSPLLPDLFQKTFGYDLVASLGGLSSPCPSTERVKHDFWKLVRTRFHENYAAQLYKWCDDNALLFTGHVLLEEECRWQTVASGSSMGFYHRQHVPGIDWLGRRIGNTVVGKQVSSAAAQSDRSRIISEMFGCAGWNSTMADLRWIVDWHFASGVNLVCQHLAGYSIRGARKRDYPPGMNHQSNWWPYYRHFNDACGRLSTVLSHGRDEADVLVIHPISTANMEVVAREEPGANWNTIFMTPYAESSTDGALDQLTTALDASQIPFHFGDEDFMAKEGTVNDGRLVVGSCAYKVLVLPALKTLSQTTVELLTKFENEGGTILILQSPPLLCDGNAGDDLITRLMGKCAVIPDTSSLIEALTAFLAPGIRFEGQNAPLQELRRLDRVYSCSSRAIFLFNRSTSDRADCTMKLEHPARIRELEPTTGTLCDFGTSTKELKIAMAPRQSRLLLVSSGDSAERETTEETTFPATEVALPRKWELQPQDLNTLLLDTCRWRSYPDGSWSSPKLVYSVQKELIAQGKDQHVELEFCFEVDEDPPSRNDIHLVVESGNQHEIFLNGTRLVVDEDCRWMEDCFKALPCHSEIRPGRNVVHVRMHFNQGAEVWERVRKGAEYESEVNMLGFDSEVETIYIRGSFLVKPESIKPTTRGDGELNGSRDRWAMRGDALEASPPFRIIKMPEILFADDATMAGFPFFNGRMNFHQTLKLDDPGKSRTVMKFPRFFAAAGMLHVNGKPVSPLLWDSPEVDLTDHLGKGTNQITVELVSTNRNLFGPHHHPFGELFAVGPDYFGDVPGWIPDYNVVRLSPGEVFICTTSQQRQE